MMVGVFIHYKLGYLDGIDSVDSGHPPETATKKEE